MGVFLQPTSHMVIGHALTCVLQHFQQQWEKAFLGEVADANHRLLFIADGHESCLSLEAIAVARDMGMDFILLPPNASHFMQPWDQIFGVIKAYFIKLADARAQLEGSADRKISKAELVGLIDAACQLAFKNNPQLLQNAWLDTGHSM